MSRSMTESEAIEYLSSKFLVVDSPLNPSKEECEKHNEAIEMAIEALEEVKRLQPQKAIQNGPGEGWSCPACGNSLHWKERKYCDCGQAIDWR